MLLTETSPAKFNIGRCAYYPYYLGASKKLTPREIWNGWHQPMIDFIKANIDVIAAWYSIAADWEVESEWNWVCRFSRIVTPGPGRTRNFWKSGTST